MKEIIPYALSILALLLAAVNTIYSRKRDAQGDWDEKFNKLSADVADYGKRQVVLETQVSVFWKGVSYSAAEALHSPTDHLGIDTLIDKFRRGQLRDEDEIAVFKNAMQNIVANDPDPFRRKAAREVLLGIRLEFEITPGAVFTEMNG